MYTPIELVKIQRQIKDSKYKTSFDCFKDHALNKGPTSLMRGLTLTVLRETPAVAIYLTSYEWLTGEKKGNKAAIPQLIVAGGVAGCLSWIFTYPIDTIKTKFQQNDSYKSSFKCAIDCFKAEGYKGFWRGLNVTLIRFCTINDVLLFLLYYD